MMGTVGCEPCCFTYGRSRYTPNTATQHTDTMFGMEKKEWEPAVATIVLVNIKKVSGDGLTPTRK